MIPAGLPHSEIFEYIGYLRLLEAYRSLSRPSSAPIAKAFSLRPFKLDLFGLTVKVIVLELCDSLDKNCFVYPLLYIMFFRFFSRFCLSFLLLALFNFQGTVAFRLGGLRWTRTIDLALIRRAL